MANEEYLETIRTNDQFALDNMDMDDPIKRSFHQGLVRNRLEGLREINRIIHIHII